MNKRRLGRGLEALLGREEGGFEPAAFDAAELSFIPVDQIDRNPARINHDRSKARDR